MFSALTGAVRQDISGMAVYVLSVATKPVLHTGTSVGRKAEQRFRIIRPTFRRQKVLDRKLQFLTGFACSFESIFPVCFVALLKFRARLAIGSYVRECFVGGFAGLPEMKFPD